MSNHKARLQRLEKRTGKQPAEPLTVEVWGMREDGTRYLCSTWRELVECDSELTDQDGNPLDLEHNRTLKTFAEAVKEITRGA